VICRPAIDRDSLDRLLVGFDALLKLAQLLAQRGDQLAPLYSESILGVVGRWAASQIVAASFPVDFASNRAGDKSWQWQIVP
jgi:hypothetical protein